ncbi:TPA: S-4TM family putative pore-forming effector [Enterobacter ludwigii]|uniref:S-4TM family putative pore-forming effector n=1 Tax=Enterobacter cloacae complex TaxID=354276 RepID=UPI0020032137|nr:S-4TM family putative pore-forming effector [Enterobacter kobei]MCK7106083.1 S-4TM family putative pore-forming effector [Enterobacter kobei]MCL8166543.1 S-4TM family putative pore-forming effector [Enterobacter kobei]MCM7794697.1 S-4TM family putative pore-forming effector [Enterobacter kobei]
MTPRRLLNPWRFILNFFPSYTLPWLRISLTTYGFIMLFINNLLLNHIGTTKKIAARLQEEFDIRLFRLEWNDVVAGKRPGPHEWVEPADWHLKKNGSDSLINWYLNYSIDLPSPVMTLLCQSKNLGWDARLKQKISDLLSVILAINGIILLILAIAINPSVAVLFSLVALLAPVYQFYYRYVSENKKSVARADELRLKVESELDKITESGSFDADHLQKLSRNIQDQIFIYRSSGNPVPDRLHRYSRMKDEERYDRIFNAYEERMKSLASSP